MTKAVIFELDGIITNYDHRKEKQANEFYDTIHRDKCNSWCKDLIDALFYKHIQIIIIAERPEKYRSQTQDWLIRHGIRYHKLLMPFDEKEADSVAAKKYIFEKQIKNKYQVLFAVERSLALIEFWNKLGFTCLAGN